MITKVSPEVTKLLIQGTREQRKYVCDREFAYFCLYYFAEYFEYKCAPHHWDFFEDGRRISKLELNEAVEIAYRESAKSSIMATMLTCYLILFKKRRYINWDAEDKANAEQGLFDIATALQTNKRILNDFGNVYGKKSGKDKKNEAEGGIAGAEPSMKRIGSFITRTGIKVEAFSAYTSTRGRKYKNFRPDHYVLDDMENSLTIESLPKTLKIIAHINELRAGMAAYGSLVFLGNYISEEGVVAYIMEVVKNNPKGVVRNIPVVKAGVIAWPDKYVLTGAEADRLNVDLPKERMKVALDRKKESLGAKVYNTEMLNDPGKSGDYYFDRDKVRRAMEKAMDPKKEVAGFKTWAVFNPTHRYGAGADTAEGIGADSNASCFIDFTVVPNLVVGTYKSNEISAHLFGDELVREGRVFGECFIIPELNNTGYATVAQMLVLKYYNMYKREVKNRTTQKTMNEWGYKTDQSNKHEIASQFKSAFEDGILEILDADLLNEMYHYTKAALRTQRKEVGMTHHFDLLKAAMLAWEARLYATLSKDDKDGMYKAPKRDAYAG